MDSMTLLIISLKMCLYATDTFFSHIFSFSPQNPYSPAHCGLLSQPGHQSFRTQCLESGRPRCKSQLQSFAGHATQGQLLKITKQKSSVKQQYYQSNRIIVRTSIFVLSTRALQCKPQPRCSEGNKDALNASQEMNGRGGDT